MNKDKVLEAANAIQNGKSDGGEFHDELEIIIGLIMDATEEQIATIWQEISTDQ